MPITKKHFDFLKKLEKNNNREWFAENKKNFDVLNKEIKELSAEIRVGLEQSDIIDKNHVFRIYRDVRFSKDKKPYKNHFSCSFSRAGADRRGGYYLHLEPGHAFIGGGFWGPNKDDLLRIRKEFEMDDSEIRDIMKQPKFKKMFGEILGDGVKTAPRGFDADHKAIDLIKKKQFYVRRDFTDAEVLDKNFPKEVVKTFEAMRPYFDYMTDVLTTDLNGVSTI